MDWQFKIGFGFCLVFGFLQFTGVVRMPNWVTWPGISVGVLFIIWGLLPNHEKIPLTQAILFIMFFAGAISCFAWGLSIYMPVTNQETSKLLLSIRNIQLINSTGSLEIDLSFHNDGTKDFAVTGIGIIIPGKTILMNLTDDDNLNNNFNNKPIMKYYGKENNIPSCWGLIVKSLPIFPLVIGAGKLYPLKIDIPFDVNEFFEQVQLTHVNNIIIGIEVHIINYEGREYRIYGYPVSVLNVMGNSNIESISYNSPSTYHIVIEKGNPMPRRIQYIRK
jgi:hypothetical protein